MRIIDTDETLTMLREVVAGREDYVYELPMTEAGLGCRSVHHVNGEYIGGCIVGTLVVDKLGIPAERIYTDNAGFTNEASSDRFTEWLEDEFQIEFTYQAAEFLSRAQVMQDGGTSWGEVLQILGKEYTAWSSAS